MTTNTNMSTKTPQTVPAHLELARQRHGHLPIQMDRDGEVTMEEMLGNAAAVAEGLRKSGVKPGDRVGLLADNSRRWIVADFGIQLARGVSVPRGTDTPTEEVADLFRHAEVGVVLAHDAQCASAVEGLRDRLPSLKETISLAPENAPGRTLDQLAEEGRDGPGHAELSAQVRGDDIATIIYTSGTTGRPKGVVLTQANFSHQIEVLPPLFTMGPEELFLSILPPWHSFERTVEYAALASGARIAYTDRRHFKDDLVRYQPTFVPSVPRLWETVHAGVKKALEKGSPIRRGLFKTAYGIAAANSWGWDRFRGHIRRVRKPRGFGVLGEAAVGGAALLTAAVTWLPNRLAHAVVFKRVRNATGGRLRGAISGGGLMPPHIDQFFRNIGVPILVGYGLTETSPVVSARREDRNVLGTIGTAIPKVEVQIRDPETREIKGPGGVGTICTRGPHIMQGYYQDPDLTKAVIDEDGWFDTGDLGFLTEEGDLCFYGRAKETIVLSGGENIEPGHVESELVASPYIQQAVVVGQDRKTLAALLVAEPDEVARKLGLDPVPDEAELAKDERVRDLLHKEAVSRSSVLAPFERVSRIAVLPGPLDVAGGCLTQTLKLKRHVIGDLYRDTIDRAYGS